MSDSKTFKAFQFISDLFLHKFSFRAQARTRTPKQVLLSESSNEMRTRDAEYERSAGFDATPEVFLLLTEVDLLSAAGV